MADFESIEQRVRDLCDKKRMGDAFEHAVTHYLRHDPAVGFTEVWLWDDWPDRIGLGLKGDQGIDLVAIDGEGRRVGIQAKFHTDPGRDVTQREVATLFSFRPDLFDRWVIVSNAMGHGPNAERATAGRGDVTWIHRDALVDSAIDWSAALGAVSGRAEPQIKLLSPREPEQVEAISDTVAALKEHERVQLIMACGTGKTLVTRWITEARDDRLALVLVPTLLLLKQFRTEWREQARTDFIDLGVCSDADTMGGDAWTVHTDELGVRVTTDPADIATFLRGEGRRVIFGTYASSARIAEAQALPGVPSFDLVVADEAHRVAGITSRGNARERDTKVVLDGARIRAKRRLFATATPRVYGPANRAMMEGREDIDLASMDDVEHFGVEAHRLWFRRAVELGRLVDYRLSVVVVTDAEVADLVRERAIVDVQGRTFDAETLASIVVLRRAIPELGLQRVISFHHTIARARDFARELERLELDAPAVSARHISGAMSMADRGRVLATLRDPVGPTVVTNARCLTEGIDVPSLDAVFFVDPRSAPVDVVQAVGRVMRIAHGKELGHVIVPVYVTEEQLADPETAIESSAFEPVLVVLRALRAHDPELVTDATRIATSLGRRDAVVGGYISEHIQVLGAEVDVTGLERALEVRLVEVSADHWEVGLAHLQQFVRREGHSRVNAAHRENGFLLGSWVSSQRARFNKGLLPEARTRALEAVSGWTWVPFEDDWQDALGHLKAYVRETGHARPLNHHVSQDGFRLGAWVTRSRVNYRSGGMPTHRAAELEALPGWSWDPKEDVWEVGFAQLQAFADASGSARPGRQLVAKGGLRLDRWVEHQRDLRRRGKLPGVQAARLEALPGWTWDPRADDWDDGLRHLLDFETETGHASPSRSHVTDDGFRLGDWIVRCRAAYRNGHLNGKRVAMLEALSGWTWDARDERGREGPEHLREYVQVHGHAAVQKTFIADDGYKLGQWVSWLRSEGRKGRLSREQRAELEALPGWTWDPSADAWADGVAHLRAYTQLTGHASPPATYVMEDGFRLGAWVNVRRTAYGRERLPPERIAELEAMPGWSWDRRNDAFRIGLEHLRAFSEEMGHANPRQAHVTHDGFALGRWVAKRRTAYRRGRLTASQATALESLPGWAWKSR